MPAERLSDKAKILIMPFIKSIRRPLDQTNLKSDWD